MCDLGFIDIRPDDTVIFDVETTGLDWRNDRPVGYVITVRRDNKIISRYYPVRHQSGPNLDPERVVSWIRSWAKLPIRLVGHNLKFDLHFAANDGIFFPRATFICTQVSGTLINESIGNYSLDNLATAYRVTAKKGEELYTHIASLFGCEPNRKSMGQFWRLPADDKLAVEYAEGDGITTLELYEKQQLMIKEQELERVAELEGRVLPVLFKMERRGVNVDEDQLEYVHQWADRKVTEAKNSLPKDLNVRSRPQMAKLFPEEDHPTLPRTPKGNPSYTEDWLKTNDIGRKIIILRQFTNLQNSFINPLLETHLHGGMVNTNFNQMFDGTYGTITGRLSSNWPNMQQVPKRDKYLAPIFRSIFTVPDGVVWSQNDYSQQEYRIFAAYTGSDRLANAYAEGLDMHQVVADLLGVERDPTAKRMNLGMLYGMGKALLADSIGITVDEASALRSKYKRQVPEVDRFMQKAKLRMEKKGFVKTIMGRRCRLEDKRFSYRAPSRVIQGTCADLTKLKMVEVNDFLESETNGKCGVTLQVHDELDWFVPEGREDLDQEARRIMGDYSGFEALNIPMKVDSANGPNWGVASFPDQDWEEYQ